MYKKYLEKRKSIKSNFLLPKRKLISKAKKVKIPKPCIKSLKVSNQSNSFFMSPGLVFPNSIFCCAKGKVCNDEWTDVDEHYLPLETGEQALFNYETNNAENSGEFFVPVPTDQINSEDECDICMEKYNNGKEVSRMTRCVHMFHTHCIQKACEASQRCPVCRVCGPKMEGNCPPGRMSWKVDDKLYKDGKGLAGYEDCKVIQIRYEMNGGYQDSRHQNPGVWYSGMQWPAYLPDNSEGRRVLELFKKAWRMKKTFTVGRSLFYNEDNRITWNDIHHKTEPFPNVQYGYPDPTYLTRVVEDMKAMGIY